MNIYRSYLNIFPFPLFDVIRIFLDRVSDPVGQDLGSPMTLFFSFMIILLLRTTYNGSRCIDYKEAELILVSSFHHRFIILIDVLLIQE